MRGLPQVPVPFWTDTVIYQAYYTALLLVVATLVWLVRCVAVRRHRLGLQHTLVTPAIVGIYLMATREMMFALPFLVAVKVPIRDFQVGLLGRWSMTWNTYSMAGLGVCVFSWLQEAMFGLIVLADLSESLGRRPPRRSLQGTTASGGERWTVVEGS